MLKADYRRFIDNFNTHCENNSSITIEVYEYKNKGKYGKQFSFLFF